jgi:hypothetical protein
MEKNNMARRKKEPDKIEELPDAVDDKLESTTIVEDEGEDVVNTLYELIFKNAPPMTDNKLKIAMALSTLRMYEIDKENMAEYAIYSAINAIKEPIIKSIMKSIIDNNLRFIDAGVILSSIMKDVAGLSVWEYENLQIADGVLGTPEEPTVKENNTHMMDIFNSLGEEDDD